MKSWNERVFINLLKLKTRERRVNVICPFHVDSNPSLSINLDRGWFYCHSDACMPPRGGGALAFLMKWARVIDKKPITESEARRRLRGAFTLPDAKTLARELLRKELLLFTEYAAPRFANRCRDIERAIQDVNAYVADHPSERHDTEIWNLLTLCHRELQWCDHAFMICNESSSELRAVTIADVIAVFLECKRREWWNVEIEAYAQRLANHKIYERRVYREFEEMREQCRRENLFHSKTPIPRKTPVF